MVSINRAATLAFLVPLLLVAALVIIRAGNVLLLLFAGVLLAIGLRALANTISRFLRISETLSLFVALAGLVLVFGVTAYFFAAALGQQAGELRSQLPQAASKAAEWARGVFPIGDLMALSSGLAQDPNSQKQLLNNLLGLASNSLGAAGGLFILLFIGIYLAADPGSYWRGLLVLLPPAREQRAAEVLTEIGEALKAWLAGKLIAMALVGVVTWLVLTLLDVPLAFILGVIAGLLDFIPNIGPLLAAIPAALMALTQGPQTLIYVILLYIAVQVAESSVIEPLIQQHQLAVPPVLIIAAQVLLGLFFGILGAALAAPLVASLVILVRRLYVEDVLGKRGAEA